MCLWLLTRWKRLSASDGPATQTTQPLNPSKKSSIGVMLSQFGAYLICPDGRLAAELELSAANLLEISGFTAIDF